MVVTTNQCTSLSFCSTRCLTSRYCESLLPMTLLLSILNVYRVIALLFFWSQNNRSLLVTYLYYSIFIWWLMNIFVLLHLICDMCILRLIWIFFHKSFTLSNTDTDYDFVYIDEVYFASFHVCNTFHSNNCV